jgi:hypothetical protein
MGKEIGLWQGLTLFEYICACTALPRADDDGDTKMVVVHPSTNMGRTEYMMGKCQNKSGRIIVRC